MTCTISHDCQQVLVNGIGGIWMGRGKHTGRNGRSGRHGDGGVWDDLPDALPMGRTCVLPQLRATAAKTTFRSTMAEFAAQPCDGRTASRYYLPGTRRLQYR